MGINKKKIAKAAYEGRKLERMAVVAPLFKHGYSYREIQAEVKARLDLKTYAVSTVKADIDALLKEWREQRITDVDANIQLELTRIDELIKEAWGAWEKSKEDYKRIRQQQNRVPKGEGGEGESEMAVVSASQMTENIVECGDPRYIDTINKLLIERRKLLGLYAPEKQVTVNQTKLVSKTSEMSFEDLEKEISRLQKIDK